MSTPAARPRTLPAVALTPHTNAATLTPEFIASILAGTPYPGAPRRPAAPVRRPTSVEEGIRWIVRGPDY